MVVTSPRSVVQAAAVCEMLSCRPKPGMEHHDDLGDPEDQGPNRVLDRAE